MSPRPRLSARTSLALVLVLIALGLLGLDRAGDLPAAVPVPENRKALPPVSTRSQSTDGNVARHYGIVTPQTPRRRTMDLGRGGTLSAALDSLGIDAAVHDGLIQQLGRVLDLGRLSPATGLLASWDAKGSLRGISVRAEPNRFVRIGVGSAAEGGTLSSQVVDLPTVSRVETAGGLVTSSVHQALSGAEETQSLVLAFADAFQWDIDLLTEPRPGDQVRAVYEVRVLGPVPEDLPPFGGQVLGTGTLLGLGRLLAASYDGQLARSTAFWVSGDADGGYYDGTGKPLKKTFLKSPLNYRRISSRFSGARRHPILRKVVPHHGVDFAAAAGTPVVAAADGRVTSAGWDGALGKAVRIRHGSEYQTVYGHLAKFARGVRAGARVHQNEVIGYVGSTGRATGPHLHYTLIAQGRPIDPLAFVNPPCEPLAPEQRPRLEEAKLMWSPVLGSIPVPGPELARGRIRTDSRSRAAS